MDAIQTDFPSSNPDYEPILGVIVHERVLMTSAFIEATDQSHMHIFKPYFKTAPLSFAYQSNLIYQIHYVRRVSYILSSPHLLNHLRREKKQIAVTENENEVESENENEVEYESETAGEEQQQVQQVQRVVQQVPQVPQVVPSNPKGQGQRTMQRARQNHQKSQNPPQQAAPTDNQQGMVPVQGERITGNLGGRTGAIRESRIKDRPVVKETRDSSLKIKIELDLEVEVDLYARVKGDITIGLL